ncbi:MAG TPA: VOC family protein [Candidatus Kapabacteria bacterium]|nr:VOC family protein [Candidatus Kapabacteria bacterium]
MADNAFQLMQIDIAATNTEAMVRFYEAVYGTTFNSFDIGPDMKIYSGTVAGMKIVMAPNEIAGVVAEQSRYQFELAVDGFDGVLDRVKSAGGSIREIEGGNGAPRVATVLDPDNNTTVLHEKL